MTRSLKDHPFFERLRSAELVQVLKGAMHALWSYQYGNGAPDLARRAWPSPC
ncbi:hypothetical protein V5F40_22760 [Xanthobacter sp. DSM 14520]|uniref:hypothetical protein n=1 Tax=Xanthobacter autotrophicus (strain ATCC BAA-1158 / Py2) TaxID=78245 RepID=UPI0037289547